MQKRMLLVDDEPANLMLLGAILESFECELLCASNGQEALEILDRQPVDMVLLDLMMPVMDGIETLRRIRARPELMTLPVVLVTAAHDRDARLRGFQAGADEFLEKPIDRPLLMVRVRNLLRLREANEQLAERARVLEALHVERRELMNLIVHDLKNPLSVIYSNLKYAHRATPDAAVDVRDALLDATIASERMHGLILDILSIERMDQSQLKIRREQTNIGAIAAEVARTHQREVQIQGLNFSTELSDGMVLADPDLLRRVVENLVENALHHTPPHGVIELRVELGAEVAIVISNTGKPIPDDMRPSLFVKYARGGGNTTSRFGLGLYFCQRVAAAHDGSVALVDRSGWPVSFRFALPAA